MPCRNILWDKVRTTPVSIARRAKGAGATRSGGADSGALNLEEGGTLLVIHHPQVVAVASIPRIRRPADAARCRPLEKDVHLPRHLERERC